MEMELYHKDNVIIVVKRVEVVITSNAGRRFPPFLNNRSRGDKATSSRQAGNRRGMATSRPSIEQLTVAETTRSRILHNRMPSHAFLA
jgi:hypothetical protein